MTNRQGTLICAVNWLGDSCMALPALTRYRMAHPDQRIIVLAKPNMHAFWRLVPAVDELQALNPGLNGLMAVRRALASKPCDRAIILPNSWRSALAPWLAGIPVRIGAGRGLRDLLLTHAIEAPAMRDPAIHQQCEYEALFGIEPEAEALPPSLLTIPPESENKVKKLLEPGNAPWVGMLPGAARGPAKQWPPERFAEVARHLQTHDGVRICLLGTEAESGLCAGIAESAGGGLNLAGRTPLAELAAVLSRCACVISNDSGGMHLAAICGTPVVAIFGLTDPAKTGPCGSGHRILMAPGVSRSRDIRRCSKAAQHALEAVTSEAAIEAIRGILGQRAEIA